VDTEVYEVTFDIDVPWLKGMARYEVNATDEESALRVARRRAVSDHLPVATAMTEARIIGPR
jgi:hypothetical protein